MLKIVFFGTPYFASTILEYLLGKKCHIVAVVTKPDKPRGRSGSLCPSPVKEMALRHGLPVYQPQKASASDFASFLQTLEVDLFIVVAYSEILKENLLTMPKKACINVHASLLPKYRGAAPIQAALKNGDSETGVTIMSMAKDLDAGDILKITKIPLSEEINAGELTQKLAPLGAEALWEVIQSFEKGKVHREKQNPELATYTKKLKSEDGEIDWRLSAREIHNHIRAMTPKPGAWCKVLIREQERRLLIKKSSYIEGTSHSTPGRIIGDDPGLLVECGQGCVRLLEVQLEGKKSLSTEDFLKGISKKDLAFKIKS